MDSEASSGESQDSPVLCRVAVCYTARTRSWQKPRTQEVGKSSKRSVRFRKRKASSREFSDIWFRLLILNRLASLEF